MRPKSKVDLEIWLGLAVWWLLKVRHSRASPEAHCWELTVFLGITQARKVYGLIDGGRRIADAERSSAGSGGGGTNNLVYRSAGIGRSPLSAPQAYANLLKSSWILEEEVLAFAGEGEHLSCKARKFARDLSMATSPSLMLWPTTHASYP
jgi:hypothetical protein